MFTTIFTDKYTRRILANRVPLPEALEPIPDGLEPSLRGTVQVPTHHATRFYSSGPRIIHRGIVYRNFEAFRATLGQTTIATEFELFFSVSDGCYYSAKLSRPVNVHRIRYP